LEAELSYIALPDVKGKVVIIADTMLATGGSIYKAIQEVKQHQPACIKVATVIATNSGIEKIKKLDDKIDVFYGCIDPKLN
jgi:uracil phosphoribosyltransferase